MISFHSKTLSAISFIFMVYMFYDSVSIYKPNKKYSSFELNSRLQHERRIDEIRSRTMQIPHHEGKVMKINDDDLSFLEKIINDWINKQ